MYNENFDNNGGVVEGTQQPKAIIIGNDGAGTENAAAAILAGLYPLDWGTTDIKLAGGRFVHTIERPSAELMLEREDELDTEIPVGRDGSYSLPDATAIEEIDAKYHKMICVDNSGYGDHEIPTIHRAKAFQGLFEREIYVDEDCDIFDEEMTVIEEIGSGDEPDFTLRHKIVVPDEKELKKIRRLFNNGKLKPGKRGRQTFVQHSNLRTIMKYFAQYYAGTSGAKIGEQTYSPERRDEFIANINPLIQRSILKAVIEKLTGNLLD